MAYIPKELAAIAKQVNEGRSNRKITVRELLSWFEAERRGYWIVQAIKKALRQLKIKTDPDFEGAYIDGYVAFVATVKGKTKGGKTSKSPQAGPAMTGQPPESIKQVVTMVQGEALVGGWNGQDPTYRIGRLAAANQKVTSVTPDAKLEKAITLMLTNDYSQLPVMQGERDVRGIISWKSIGSRLALGNSCIMVKDCMEDPHEVTTDTSIFAAIGLVAEHEYVLVRGSDKRIVGIVTTSDLSLQFRQLAEPFLLIGEIENHVRNFIDSKFALADLLKVRDPADSQRKVETVADLTFGEYTRLLQDPAGWEKVKSHFDRGIFVELLDRVREIRNDVMHFDPDGLTETDLDVLRRFTSFFQRIRDLQAIA